MKNHKRVLEEKLTEYINRLFEQEQRWMIVSSIIRKSNDFMDINKLSEFFCSELQKLVCADVCVFCLFKNKSADFRKFSASAGDNIAFIEKILMENKHQTYPFIIKKLQETMPDFFQKNCVFPIMQENEFLLMVCVLRDFSTFQSGLMQIIEIICDNYKQSVARILLYKQLTDANRHKTEFIANVTHEFKTPLNAIIGFAELLNIQNFSKEKTRHFVTNIVTNSRHMLQLIENILDVSKAELNRLELVYETANTKKLIEEIITTLESMLISKNIQLTSILANITVELDKTRFKQVIYNLLNNAIKYTDNCGYIKLLSYIRDDNFYFEIENSGKYIKKSVREKIFDSFTQGNNKFLSNEKGHGLGLFICKNIVSLHGGEIFLDTTNSKFTTFKFFIPLKKKISDKVLN